MGGGGGRRWRCGECGKDYGERAATRAMRNGCAAGCSGLDVQEVLAARPERVPTPPPAELGRAVERAIQAVWRQPHREADPRPHVTAWVWATACGLADPESGVWSGPIAEMCGRSVLSERTIRTSLKALARWGWVEVASRGRAGIRLRVL